MQHTATVSGADQTNLTSWEGHNYVLKGYVDELISLGARPQLKLVTLQLWAKYLNKLEIAFTSKTKPLLPKFGLHQSSKDYAIIQGIIKTKKHTLKTLLKAKRSTSRLNGKTPSVNKKLKLKSNVYLDVDVDLVNAELAFSRNTLKEIDFRIKVINSTNEVRNCKISTETIADCIELSKRTQTAFTKIVEMTSSSKVPHVSHSTCFDPMFLTKNMVLAILCLAMFFSKDTIQISDIIRWIVEGHVSYLNMLRLFPDGIKVTLLDPTFKKTPRLVRYKSLQRCVFHMANMMGVEHFPAPDLVALARRFLVELQLPSEMGVYVERLMASCHLERCGGMMSYEAVVISFIIVVLKTLFGLDGRTEHCVSEFAVEMNGLMDNVDEAHLGSRLFVWDNWVRYIECRKSVLVNNHFPLKYREARDLSTAAGQYVHHCSREQFQNQRGAIRKHRPRNRHNSRRFSLMVNAVGALPTTKKIKKGHYFPPSLTPQVSYLEQILSRKGASKNKSGCDRHMDILTFDHTTTSVEFLIEPNTIKEFALSQGVDVVITESPVRENVEYISTNSWYKTLRLPGVHQINIEIKDEVDRQCEKQGEQQSCYNKRASEKTAMKRKINHHTSDNDAGLFKKNKKMREKENSLTSWLNGSSNSNPNQDNINGGKGSSKHKQIKDRTRAVSSTEHNTRTLHIPLSAYWVYEIGLRTPETFFEKRVESDFPDSFCWLLRECTRMLEMKTLDLYRVLRQVEKLCAGDTESTELELKFRVRNLWHNR